MQDILINACDGCCYCVSLVSTNEECCLCVMKRLFIEMLSLNTPISLTNFIFPQGNCLFSGANRIFTASVQETPDEFLNAFFHWFYRHSSNLNNTGTTVNFTKSFDHVVQQIFVCSACLTSVVQLAPEDKILNLDAKDSLSESFSFFAQPCTLLNTCEMCEHTEKSRIES